MDTSKEFLNPSSMLTPGFAGGMTMAITNVVSAQFALSAPGPAYVGLGLSFLFGLLALVSKDVSLLQRGVYYVLNSLVIFVVAVGSNSVGRVASDADALSAMAIETPATAAGGFIISNAVAQTAADKGWCCVGEQTNPATRAECSKWSGKFFSTEDAAKQACMAARLAKDRQGQNGFFRPWVRVQGT
jgi:hypothetical protein